MFLAREPVLTVFIFALAPSMICADDALTTAQRQHEQALARWKRVMGEVPPIQAESAHFIVLSSSPHTAMQVKNLAATLERALTLARKPLRYEPQDEVWPGKAGVYLLDEPEQLHTFMLAVAKKRPDPDSLGVASLRRDFPFVAGCGGTEKYDPNAADQVVEQLAAAMLTSKVGRDAPDWVVSGFGRATVWHASPAAISTRSQRALARKLLAAGRSADDVWSGKLSAFEAGPLQASLVDFLAYGLGPQKFTALAEAFRPERPRQQKTAAEAFRAAGLDPTGINRVWHAWARRH